MLPTAVIVALVGSIAARRAGWVRDRLPPPASTALMGVAAAAALLALAGMDPGGWRAAAVGALTMGIGLAAIAITGLIMDLVVAPLRRRMHRRPPGPSVRERVIARADAVRWRVGKWNLVSVAVRSVLRAGDVRTTGLAAEMSYYALISLVPITTALGASLGFLEPILGKDGVEQVRTTIVDALTNVFAQQVTSDILAPLVNGLLDEGSGSVAIGAMVVTLYLASRVFRAAVRALEDAYRVESRRNVVTQYLLGFAFTIGVILTLVSMVLLVVVGPLLGGGEAIADTFGLGSAFQTAWDALRWPVALAIMVAFLTLLYRYAPNVTITWTRCLPGAAIGAAGVLLVSAGFALYVQIFSPGTLPEESSNALVVRAAAQMLSLVLAGVLWLWLISIVMLVGGIVNAELHDERRQRARDAARTTAAETETPEGQDPATG